MVDSWFRFYNSARNSRKVSGLSPICFRCWVLLLTIASEKNGDIPKDFADLAFELRMEPKRVRLAVQTLLDVGLLVDCETFFRTPDWNERQFKSDSSRERVAAFRKRQRNVTVTAQESETEQNIKRESKDSRSKPPKGDFDGLWVHVPKKVGKRSANKAYERALTRSSPELILEGMKRYAASRAGQDEQFTAHAATWLNRDGWLDQAPATGKGAAVPDTGLIEIAERERAAREKMGIKCS